MSLKTRAIELFASVARPILGLSNSPREALLKSEAIAKAIASAAVDDSQLTPEGTDEMQMAFIQKLRRNPWIFAAVHEKASSAGMLPWKLMRYKGRTKDGEENSEEIYDHPLLDLLEKPNDEMGSYSFMESAVWWLDNQGNTFWELVFPGDGEGSPTAQPEQMWVMRSDRMEIFPDQKKLYKKYVYTPNDKPIEFKPHQLIHIKYFNLDSEISGYAPVNSAKDAIEVDRKGVNWNKSLLGNAAIPGLVLETDQSIPRHELRRLRREVAQLLQGDTRAFNTAILQGGMKAKTLALSLKDMNFIDIRKMSREEVLAVTDVPPIKVGLLDHASWANAHEQHQSFWRGAMQPLFAKITEKLNLKLTPRYGDDLRLEPNFEGHMDTAEDQERVERRAVGLVTAKLITVDEGRKMIGRAPLSDEQKAELAATPDAGQPPDNGAPADLSMSTDGQFPDVAKSMERRFLKQVIRKGSHFTKFGRILVWKSLTSVRDRHESDFKKIMHRMFMEQRAQITSGILRNLDITKSQVPDVARYIASGRNGTTELVKSSLDLSFIPRILQMVYKRHENKIKRGLEDAAHEAGNVALKAAVLKAQYNSFTDRVAEKINQLNLKLSKQINKTTEEAIKSALLEGYQNHDTLEEIAAAVEDALGPELAMEHRPAAIAKTELGDVVNFGALDAFQQEGVVEKEWMANQGPVPSRPAHAAADGQRVAIDQPFSVGGEQLMHPCDNAASPENRINCYCGILPVIPEAQGNARDYLYDELA